MYFQIHNDILILCHSFLSLIMYEHFLLMEMELINSLEKDYYCIADKFNHL